MFKNEYQGGPYLEIFSPQGPNASANWKLTPSVKKVYEKEVKGFVHVLEGTSSTTKMTIPKDNKQSMTLVQRFLVLQVYLFKGPDFSLELGVCDLCNNKRRLQLSTALKETQITPLHARLSLSIVRRAVWLNLCLDLVSLVGETWSGQTYRGVETITVSANCKLRRIFTMKSQPPDTTDDHELYGVQNSIAGSIELIPKQMQLAPDVAQHTQVLSMEKIKSAERAKSGKTVSLAEQFRPASTLDIDLNSSGTKGNYRIAFGSKVTAAHSESSRRTSRQGSTSSRSIRSTLSRADGSFGSGSVHDLRDSQDIALTSRSGVKDVGQRWSKPSLTVPSAYGRQTSEPVTQEEQDTLTSNGVGSIVTPHPPREPSKDRVRRYHRVKSFSTSGTSSHNGPGAEGVNTTKDRVSSAGSITEETTEDSGVCSKINSSPSSATQLNQTGITTTGLTEASRGSRDSPKAPVAVGRRTANVTVMSQDSTLSDVIALLRSQGIPARQEEDPQSSDSGSDSSQLGEYEETDDEGSSDTANQLHLFASRPMMAPRRNVSPSTTDQDPSKRTLSKAARSNVRRSASEILTSRGARPEDDFHSGMTSSDEEEHFHTKPRPGQGSRPHSGSPKTRAGNSAGDRNNSGSKVRAAASAASLPKASVSPELQRPPFNPALYGGATHSVRMEPTPPRHTPVRHSRKSLREIKPRTEEGVRQSKTFEKGYDHTKYQLAEVTESFEARMLLSMKRHEEEELQDPSPPPITQAPPLHKPRLPVQALGTRTSLQGHSESPYTTSDDDTSFSTWKAPALNGAAHNYQDEMKSHLSSDTLTSSNPRDWSNVFSPPLPLPSDPTRDLQGTLEGQFEDLNDAGPHHAHATGPSASEDEELDLMFDANLNCYYDPRTLKYYELAT